MSTDHYLFSDDEMNELRRDYLADVAEKAILMRGHAGDLANRAKFKSAFPILLFLSHQLKGSGGSLGFPRVSEIARTAGDALNLFLDDEQPARPSPKELSKSLLLLCDQLDASITQSRLALG